MRARISSCKSCKSQRLSSGARNTIDFAQAPKVPAARIRELAEGGYIERSEPVVLIGECSTGKSHLATGLCLAACRQKRRVPYKKVHKKAVKLAKVSHNGAYDDQATMKDRRFVPEKF